MFPRIGLAELVVLLVIVLLLFGAKRLPELAGSIGRSVKAFKDGLKDAASETTDTKCDRAPTPKTSPPKK